MCKRYLPYLQCIRSNMHKISFYSVNGLDSNSHRLINRVNKIFRTCNRPLSHIEERPIYKSLISKVRDWWSFWVCASKNWRFQHGRSSYSDRHLKKIEFRQDHMWCAPTHATQPGSYDKTTNLVRNLIALIIKLGSKVHQYARGAANWAALQNGVI